MEKIVVVPDSFKGSMSSREVCDIIASEIKSFDENIIVRALPIADGGEGTLSCFTSYFGYNEAKLSAHNHLGDALEASIGIKDKSVIIEAAEVIGLALSDIRNPYSISSYPLGELIMKAIRKYHPEEIILTLGGSATNDLGIGALEALGVEFYDSNNNRLNNIIPTSINKIKSFNIEGLKENIRGIKFIILNDVKNPLCGPLGATRTFGPQKGIKNENIDYLDRSFLAFNRLVVELLKKDNKDLPGAGAAGGLGYMALTFLNAEAYLGIDKILSMLDFNNEIIDASLIIAGEGRLDSQSMNGKAISKIASIAKSLNKRLIVLCGECRLKDYNRYGITKAYEINNGLTDFNLIKRESRANLRLATKRLLADIYK